MASSVGVENRDELRLAELDRLELALRRLLDAWDAQQRRLLQAEAQVRELEAALEAVRSGGLDPLELGARVERLEAENTALRERIRAADALVQRIQARLQLLEDDR